MFGSVAYGEAKPQFDIDLMADFAPSMRSSLMTLSGLRLQLCDLLGTEVNLSSASAMKEPVRTNADARPCISFGGPEMHFRNMLQAINLIEQFINGIDFQAYRTDIVERMMP